MQFKLNYIMQIIMNYVRHNEKFNKNHNAINNNKFSVTKPNFKGKVCNEFIRSDIWNDIMMQRLL